MKQFVRQLKKLCACSEAIEYVEQFDSLQGAWDACERGDWMLWQISKTVGKRGTKSRRKLVLAAAKCARTAWKWMPPQGKVAIRLAERYGAGDKDVTLDMLLVAADVADVHYADYAATVAAQAAAVASYADYAAFVPGAAANAAYAGDDVAGPETVIKKCVMIVRKMYPTPPKLKE